MKQHYVAIENAANSSSVALLSVDAQARHDIVVRQHYAGQQNAENILPMLDELLREQALAKQDLQGVAFSQGPGAFTGLRVACGVAQGLALGLGLEVVAVDSLRATASMVSEPEPYDVIVALLDARMQEAYLAVYQVNSSAALNWPALQEPVLIAANDVIPWLISQLATWQEKYQLSAKPRIYLCGNALVEFAEVLEQGFQEQVQQIQEQGVVFQLGHTEWPHAGVLLSLAYQAFEQGLAMAPELVAPLYLRDKVAYTTAEREQGMGGNPKAPLPKQDNQNQYTQQCDQLQAGLSSLQARIESMQLKDVQEVAAIEEQVQADPWTPGMFTDSLRANYAAWLVRHQDGRVMGYALQMFAPDVAHLLTIAVAPEFQQKGIGSILLAWTEMQALGANLDAQMLEVRVSNQAARALYQKQGYQAIGIRKGYYKGVDGQSEDAQVLQKNLL